MTPQQPPTADPPRPFTVHRDGMTLHGTVEGRGDDVLFLHGLTNFAAVQRRFVPEGYRVAAYDQRGHGDATPTTDPAAFAIREFAADALAALDALAWRAPVVCGTSMGAAVALRLALDAPERVRALVLIGPAFGDAPNAAIDRFDATATGLERVGIPGVLPLIRKAQVTRGMPEKLTAYLETWAGHRDRPLAAAVRTVSRWTFDDLDRIAALPMPVVVACWPDDDMHPATLAERIAALARTEPVRLPSVYDVIGRPECVAEALAAPLHNALGRASGEKH